MVEDALRAKVDEFVMVVLKAIPVVLNVPPFSMNGVLSVNGLEAGFNVKVPPVIVVAPV